MILCKVTTFIGVKQKPWTFVPTHQYSSDLRYMQIIIKDKLPDWTHVSIPPEILTKLEVNQVSTEHHLLHCVLFCKQRAKYQCCNWTERKHLVDRAIDDILRELNAQRGHPIIRGFGRTKLQSLIADQNSTADQLYWLVAWYFNVNLLIITDYQAKLVFGGRDYDVEKDHILLLHNSQGWLSPIVLGDQTVFNSSDEWFGSLIPPDPVNSILNEMTDHPKCKLNLEQKLLISSKTREHFLQQDRFRSLSRLKASELRELATKHNIPLRKHGKNKTKAILAEELSWETLCPQLIRSKTK